MNRKLIFACLCVALGLLSSSANMVAQSSRCLRTSPALRLMNQQVMNEFEKVNKSKVGVFDQKNRLVKSVQLHFVQGVDDKGLATSARGEFRAPAPFLANILKSHILRTNKGSAYKIESIDSARGVTGIKVTRISTAPIGNNGDGAGSLARLVSRLSEEKSVVADDQKPTMSLRRPAEALKKKSERRPKN